MPLSDRALPRSLALIISRLKAAAPHVDWDVTGGMRDLLAVPGAIIAAAPMQRTDAVRQQSLARVSSLSRQQISDLLANLLEELPDGTRSRTVIELELASPEAFVLDPYPYFIAATGALYRPVERVAVSATDYEQRSGAYVLRLPVISEDVGASSRVAAGALTRWRDMPVRPLRMSNPSASVGGDETQSGEDLIDALRETRAQGGTAQEGGLYRAINALGQSTRDVRVERSGTPNMQRDELWVDADGIYNLQRRGAPAAVHKSVGTLSPSTAGGRLVASSGVFEASDEGKRLMLTDDPLGWRRIQRVISSTEIVVSGQLPDDALAGVIWGEGEHAGSMSDVYLYAPTPRIYSKTIRKSWSLVAAFGHTISLTTHRLYYQTAPGTAYTTFGEAGWVVFNQGLPSEVAWRVLSVGQDSQGKYLEVEEVGGGVAISPSQAFTFWDMRHLYAGEDISPRPVISILSIEQLDPITLRPIGEIPQAGFGKYNSPGWYAATMDGVYDLSTRSERVWRLDDRATSPTHQTFAWSATEVERLQNDAGTLSVSNIVDTAEAVSALEGRLVTYELPASLMQVSPADTVTSAVVTRSSDRTVLTGATLNTRFLSDVGYRDTGVDVTVEYYDGGFSPIGSATYGDGEVRLAGQTITLVSGVFDPGNVATSYAVTILFDDLGSLHDQRPEMSVQRESVVTQSWSTFIAFVDEDLVVVSDKDGPITQVQQVNVAEDVGSFGRGPVRVTWASHEVFGQVQQTIAEENRLIADDTLVRSYMPALIDMTLTYSGPASEADMRGRFADLLIEAQRVSADGETLKLSMSNIIAALDDEGLSDRIETTPEVRVEVFGDDGLSTVYWANPTTSVLQEAALISATTVGARELLIGHIDDIDALPGRGKVRLGGRNPATQELLYYEAIVIDGDEAYVVLRGSTPCAYVHAAYEEVRLMARDFDEALVFDDEIVVPSYCRPYIRTFLPISEDA